MLLFLFFVGGGEEVRNIGGKREIYEYYLKHLWKEINFNENDMLIMSIYK